MKIRYFRSSPKATVPSISGAVINFAESNHPDEKVAAAKRATGALNSYGAAPYLCLPICHFDAVDAIQINTPPRRGTDPAPLSDDAEPLTLKVLNDGIEVTADMCEFSSNAVAVVSASHVADLSGAHLGSLAKGEKPSVRSMVRTLVGFGPREWFLAANMQVSKHVDPVIAASVRFVPVAVPTPDGNSVVYHMLRVNMDDYKRFMVDLAKYSRETSIAAESFAKAARIGEAIIVREKIEPDEVADFMTFIQPVKEVVVATMLLNATVDDLQELTRNFAGA